MNIINLWHLPSQDRAQSTADQTTGITTTSTVLVVDLVDLVDPGGLEVQADQADQGVTLTALLFRISMTTLPQQIWYLLRNSTTMHCHHI